ncbi:MAG TPA: hypothetical protein VHG93_16230, partial [Longimicrobium sp.]|nr:hypothetical protein [Longimicrobium sp.]
ERSVDAAPPRFLLFWAAIHAMEWSVTLEAHPNSASAAGSYAAAKFFFALARNVALLRGQALSSYAMVTAWLEHEYGVDARCAYRIKVGRANPADVGDAERLLEPATLEHLLGPGAHAALVPLGSLVDQLRSGGRCVLRRSPMRYASTAMANRYREGLLPIIAHGVKKLRGIRASPATLMETG